MGERFSKEPWTEEGPPAIEDTVEPEYPLVTPEERAWLSRPLDADDIPWMRACGADIPLSDEGKRKWFEAANQLMITSSEDVGAGRDPIKNVTYMARLNFIDHFPVIAAGWRMIGKTRVWWPMGLNLVSSRRAIYSMLKCDNKFLHEPLNLTWIHGEALVQRARNIMNYGITPQWGTHIHYLTMREATFNRHARVLKGIAHVAGIDEHVAIATAAATSEARIFTLARTMTALFATNPPEEISERDLFTMYRGGSAEVTIATYLTRGQVIRTISGLAYQIQFLAGYSPRELRGYIYGQYLKKPTDKVLRTYFRHYPLAEGEADRLEILEDLPLLAKGDVRGSSYGGSGAGDSLFANTIKKFENVVSNVSKAPLDTQNELFKQVSKGLRNKQGLADYYEGWEDDLDRGVEACKQLTTMYAANVVELAHGRMFSEDLLQTYLVCLIWAVHDFVENKPGEAINAEEFWPFAKKYIEDQAKEREFSKRLYEENEDA